MGDSYGFNSEEERMEAERMEREREEREAQERAQEEEMFALAQCQDRIAALESANAKLTAELAQLRADYARQGRENKALRAALEPFEDLFLEGSEDYPDDTKVICKSGPTIEYGLSLGDFRRARAALNGETE